LVFDDSVPASAEREICRANRVIGRLGADFLVARVGIGRWVDKSTRIYDKVALNKDRVGASYGVRRYYIELYM